MMLQNFGNGHADTDMQEHDGCPSYVIHAAGFLRIAGRLYVLAGHSRNAGMLT